MAENPLSALVAALFLTSVPLPASEPPNPLAAPDGSVATSPEAWREKVRPVTLAHFRQQVYGTRPAGKPADLAFEVVREDTKALDGAAGLKEISIRFSGPNGKMAFPATLLTPNTAQGPVPTFLLINFDDPDPALPPNLNGRWPVRQIIARGYATVSFNFNAVDPDRADGFKEGVRALFGEEPQADDSWAALSAWGWGASRVLDYLETDRAIDAKRVAIIGHSRAGKAAVWCGAEDERFAMVISNNSGSGGAALSRGKQGERVADITTRFPHWFCANYRSFSNREDDLPIDQHQLLGLIAPRPLYVASATEDAWADPKAEFKSCVLAGPVYELHGRKGLDIHTVPPPDQALHGGSIAYHLRTGKHELTSSDWQHYLDFADKTWGRPGH